MCTQALGVTQHSETDEFEILWTQFCTPEMPLLCYYTQRKLVTTANIIQTMCQTQQNAQGLWTVTSTRGKHTNTTEWWQHGCAAKRRQNNSQRQFWATKRHLIISAESFLAAEQCSLVTSCCILLPAPVASCSLFLLLIALCSFCLLLLVPVASCSLLLLPLSLCSSYLLLFVPVTSCYFPSYSRPYLVPIFLYLARCFTLKKHTSHKNW